MPTADRPQMSSPSAEDEATTAPPTTSTRRRGFSLGNRPPLTGVRALALFTVLIYHSNFHTLPGTWVALQIFFVLSGFLITAMLSAEGKRNDRISLRNFYERRAARLLPPLLLTVGLLAIYASIVHVADAAERASVAGVVVNLGGETQRLAQQTQRRSGVVARAGDGREPELHVDASGIALRGLAVRRRRGVEVVAREGDVTPVKALLQRAHAVARRRRLRGGDRRSGEERGDDEEVPHRAHDTPEPGPLSAPGTRSSTEAPDGRNSASPRRAAPRRSG